MRPSSAGHRSGGGRRGRRLATVKRVLLTGMSGTGKSSVIAELAALGYMAAKTKKLRLGTLVTPIPFRPPGMLAKIVATLDVISSGRAILGVGAGWSQTEFEGYSEWTDGKTRVDRTEEGVGRGSFESVRHHQVGI